MLFFTFNPIPFIGVGQAAFRAVYGPEFRGKICIDLDKANLVGRNIFFRENGVGRALRHANRAVDAFVGVDNEKIGPFPEAIDRADVDTISVLTFNTVFGNHVGHSETPAKMTFRFVTYTLRDRNVRCQVKHYNACFDTLGKTPYGHFT
jgi:hypothetical protein|tara:strand:+ start:331 stop:777 length:447 start_codon:yes stop_codon:yes gene_type:complete